jgi:hypothetical protein
MSEKPETRKGVVLDIKTIIQTIKYYAIIGIGLGVLAVIILFQLGGDSGVGIVGGILSLVILSFAVLSGPIIAAFVGFATSGNALGDVRTRTINSGIANGIGFAVFGIIVATILFIGLAAISGGGGGTSTTSGGGSSIEIGKLITLIILMIIPNSIVGGGITFLSAGESPTRQINSEEAAAKQSVEQASSSSNPVQGVREKISRRQIIAGTGAGGILALAGGWYEFIREPTPIDTVDRWWKLYAQGDLEAIRQLYHQSSLELDKPYLDETSEQEFGPDEEISWEINETKIISRDSGDETENYDEVIVQRNYIWDNGADRYENVQEMSLRAEKEEWKIWRITYSRYEGKIK